MPAERPKTLRRLKHVYDNANNINGTDANKTTTNHDESPNDAGHKRKSSSSSTSSGNDRDKSLSLLSPFDEQEEWAKISEIMASFGTGLVRESVFVTELEQEFQARLGLSCSQSSLSAAASSTPVGQWLSSLGFVEYEQLFISSGYDDLDFINGVIDENELKDMGISNESDRTAILEAVKSLPLKIKEQHQHYNNNVDESIDTVDEWLRRIHLEKYAETFSKHLYSEMDRIRRIWEVELMAVLEIQKSGHRKRILMSVMGNSEGGFGPNFDDINSDLNALKNNIQQLKNEIKEVPAPVIPALTVIPSPHTAPTSTPGTETLRRNHKKNRPAPQPPTAAIKPADLEIRSPSELLFGVPATLQTQWRHPPVALVTGSVTYIANYLGSTVVKELRGTESTKKSIQKLKKSTSKDQRSTPDIVLSISYRGVKFLNTLTQELICEHEIRNINCACQDSDDMTHFAYITKDHTTNNHFCHVFYVPTMDQATAIILTLGQAFEVAYQMALREQVTNKGHTRSQSANQITGGSPGRAKISLATNNGVAHPATNHGRSHSINEIKLNGHQLSLAPMLTTEDVHKSGSNSPRTPTGKAPIAIKDEM